MFPFNGGEPVYRLEPVFQKEFFKKNGIKSISDLLFVDFAHAWETKFKFVRLNWKKIIEKTKNTHLSNLIQGLQNSIADYSSSESQYPTELDIYDMVKMILKNETDWGQIYNSLPTKAMRDAFHEYWINPKKFESPDKLPRMRTPKEVFKELMTSLASFINAKF